MIEQKTTNLCCCEVTNDVYQPDIPAQQIILVFLFIILLVHPEEMDVSLHLNFA